MLRRRRGRSAGALAGHDFLLREAAERLADRTRDVARRFDRVLALGDGSGLLPPLLPAAPGMPPVRADLSEARLAAGGPGPRAACDEEALPFAAESFDLIMALWNLHWVNDLPGALIQIRRCLRPDGLFLAVLPGGETLKELRESLLAVAGGRGLSPRIAPFVDVRDAGALLQRAGFALPVADSERLTASYAHAFALLDDLRGMGEANILALRQRHFTSRGFWTEVAAAYRERHADGEGRIPATFELVTLTGWRPGV